GVCWFGFPARTPADKEPSSPKKSAAQEIAQDWIPRGDGVGAWHDIGAGCPKDSPASFVASFRTSQLTFAEAWEACATKCGADKKYNAHRLEVTAGKGDKGCWALVETRSGPGADRGGVFVPERKVLGLGHPEARERRQSRVRYSYRRHALTRKKWDIVVIRAEQVAAVDRPRG